MLTTTSIEPKQNRSSDSTETELHEARHAKAPPSATPPRDSYNQDTALNIYLKEISVSELLTAEQEIELAGRIKKGDEKAVRQMIEANLRLVVKIAHDYENFGLPLLDLINEGNIGLMKAVKRFDPGKGGKLSTYGAWWIKQSIKRALSDQSKTIRLPVHVVDKLAKIRRISAKLQDVLGREPSDEEVAHELGMPCKRVSELRRAATPPISLDAPVNDDESNCVGETVADENNRTPLEKMEQEALKGYLQEALASLSPREQEVLRYRFGLDSGPEKTLDEVGIHFKVSRERIRQIQNLALLKLRKKINTFDSGENMFSANTTVEESEGHHDRN